MNKQQLAAKIWESANKMRSKIEANEYKDYILGFIFYKFLSEKEEQYLKQEDWDEEDLLSLDEEDEEVVESIKRNIGYFIPYKYLYSTWIKKGRDFSIQDVTEALFSFNRQINPIHKKVFEGIFETLETGLTKLGDTDASRSKAISELIYLIKDIPMDGKQGYDVLGFIYEYLIEKFAANAGKKAGEFYTPHEVSLLMSEIVAHHLKDRETIEIYDSTSGSGSLLINIGKSASKYIESQDKIKYYAQELKRNTYNLTRMNLVMRGVKPNNINTRNGDTLEEDWPYFEESDPISTYEALYVDAVVSNPPYSQNWSPEDKENDPRYSGYGLAPKGKADYAFLLHDLYHIKPDGIMSIVLPHGVLFRGEEAEIRKNLVEKNNIDAIIGLPANIFYGTSIPTIIMVLKQKRTNTDILMIDASKGFIKEGKNNKLRACDIKKIVDTVIQRRDAEKYARVVSRDEIRLNDYNLNLTRYVDSFEANDVHDIYASMFGGLPIAELDQLQTYWDVFPSLRDKLFVNTSAEYCQLKEENIKQVIYSNEDVNNFISKLTNNVEDYGLFLESKLLKNIKQVNVPKTEEILANQLFKELEGYSIIDKYVAYQLLDDNWIGISNDLEMINTEGFATTKVVEPNMVIKKKNNKEQEVQEGWKGRILPFELVQQHLLHSDLQELISKKNRLNEINDKIEELIASLSEDNQSVLNDDNSGFDSKELKNAYKDVTENISSPEIEILSHYSKLSTNEKKELMAANPEIKWENMKLKKDGTVTATSINAEISKLKSTFKFPEDSFEGIVSLAVELSNEEKNIKKEIKEKEELLQQRTKETIESLSDEQVVDLLSVKWIAPITEDLMKIPERIIVDLETKINHIVKKYETTLSEIESQIKQTENELVSMIDELEANEYDMLGLMEFKKLLGGI